MTSSSIEMVVGGEGELVVGSELIPALPVAAEGMPSEGDSNSAQYGLRVESVGIGRDDLNNDRGVEDLRARFGPHTTSTAPILGVGVVGGGDQQSHQRVQNYLGGMSVFSSSSGDLVGAVDPLGGGRASIEESLWMGGDVLALRGPRRSTGGEDREEEKGALIHRERESLIVGGEVGGMMGYQTAPPIATDGLSSHGVTVSVSGTAPAAAPPSSGTAPSKFPAPVLGTPSPGPSAVSTDVNPTPESVRRDGGEVLRGTHPTPESLSRGGGGEPFRGPSQQQLAAGGAGGGGLGTGGGGWANGGNGRVGGATMSSPAASPGPELLIRSTSKGGNSVPILPNQPQTQTQTQPQPGFGLGPTSGPPMRSPPVPPPPPPPPRAGVPSPSTFAAGSTAAGGSASGRVEGERGRGSWSRLVGPPIRLPPGMSVEGGGVEFYKFICSHFNPTPLTGAPDPIPSSGASSIPTPPGMMLRQQFRMGSKSGSGSALEFATP